MQENFWQSNHRASLEKNKKTSDVRSRFHSIADSMKCLHFLAFCVFEISCIFISCTWLETLVSMYFVISINVKEALIGDVF